MVISRDDDLGVTSLRLVQDVVRCLDVGNEVSVLHWHEGEVHAQFGIFSYEDSVLVGKVLKGFLLTQQNCSHVVHVVRVNLFLSRALSACAFECCV